MMLVIPFGLMYPIKLKFKTEFLPFSGTLFTRNYYWQRTVDDYGFVFSDIQSLHFGQVDSKSQYVDLSVNLGGDTVVALSGVKFGHISILSNQIWHKYYRTYSKMQEVMASIGGVSSADVLGVFDGECYRKADIYD